MVVLSVGSELLCGFGRGVGLDFSELGWDGWLCGKVGVGGVGGGFIGGGRKRGRNRCHG